MPFTSVTVAVKVLKLVPLATTLLGTAVKVDTRAVVGSAVKVTVGELAVCAEPFVTVAEIVDTPVFVLTILPVDTPVASVTEPCVIVVPLVIPVCANTTVAPCTKLPYASVTVAVKALVVVPLATTLLGTAVKVDTCAVVESGVKVIATICAGVVPTCAVILSTPAKVPFKVEITSPLASVTPEVVKVAPVA